MHKISEELLNLACLYMAYSVTVIDQDEDALINFGAYCVKFSLT